MNDVIPTTNLSNVTADDVKAFVDSLLNKATPWNLGCAALMTSLWVDRVLLTEELSAAESKVDALTQKLDAPRVSQGARCKYGHDGYWITLYGNCMACRVVDARKEVDALMREQLQPWADDVALMGPDAPKWNGQIEHLIRYLLTVYKRFGNTAITADLQWGASALHKQDAQQYDIAYLEATVENLMREKEELIGQCAVIAAIHSQYPITDEYDKGYDKARKDAAMAIRALVREQNTSKEDKR